MRACTAWCEDDNGGRKGGRKPLEQASSASLLYSRKHSPLPRDGRREGGKPQKAADSSVPPTVHASRPRPAPPHPAPRARRPQTDDGCFPPKLRAGSLTGRAPPSILAGSPCSQHTHAPRTGCIGTFILDAAPGSGNTTHLSLSQRPTSESACLLYARSSSRSTLVGWSRRPPQLSKP
eukprot:1922428-Rhodomonas_salina.1